jgi:hypothetical protein
MLLLITCKVDKCKTINCQNGSSCVDSFCNCPPGYTGAECQTKIDKCATVNCQNGGTCLDGTCSCPAGFSGTNCELKDGTVGFYCTTDFGLGTLDVYVDYAYKGTLKYTSPNITSCENAGFFMTLKPGSHFYSIESSNGIQWNGFANVVNGECILKPLKYGDGIVPVGNFVPFTISDLGVGEISVKIDNVYRGTISKYYPNSITNCSESDLVVSLWKGVHIMNATATNGRSWNYNVTIKKGECTKFQLIY